MGVFTIRGAGVLQTPTLVVVIICYPMDTYGYYVAQPPFISSKTMVEYIINMIVHFPHKFVYLYWSHISSPECSPFSPCHQMQRHMPCQVQNLNCTAWHGWLAMVLGTPVSGHGPSMLNQHTGSDLKKHVTLRHAILNSRIPICISTCAAMLSSHGAQTVV